MKRIIFLSSLGAYIGAQVSYSIYKNNKNDFAHVSHKLPRASKMIMPYFVGSGAVLGGCLGLQCAAYPILFPMYGIAGIYAYTMED